MSHSEKGSEERGEEKGEEKGRRERKNVITRHGVDAIGI